MKNIFKRTRQFWRALTAKMTTADQALVSRYLTGTEQTLFYQMDVAIQRHCINVAYTLEKLVTDRVMADIPDGKPDVDQALLIKAALLHDIGKINGQFTIMDRVWFVLVRKISRRLAKRIAKKGDGSWPARLRNAFYIHVHHSQQGAELAIQSGLPDEVVCLIRHHHDPQQPGDSHELRLLRRADELN